MSIRLTPAGRLRWEPSGDEAAPARPPSLQGAFETDWREALFTLAAERTPTRGMPSVRYWQQLAERHLTGLCHVPEDAESFEVEPLSAADCARWILTAPPMHGGEYLCEEILQRIWERLDGWVRETVSRTGGLAAFLRERAPKWRQVGRVCFHLAENRNDEARPFAFMATYAPGFGAAGRVKHLPLRKALEQYAGAENRAALVKLLSPVQQAAESCGWVKDLVDSGDGEYRPADSGKFLRLAEICEELAGRQERVLVFTQFREVIDPLAEHPTAIFRQSGLVLHGATGVGERRGLVARFQSDDGPPFFILSLKAGGTGLNLTAASHVIHFDRWWNPAVENQATDRAFRIGQRRNVLVHKFMTTGTVEERIDEMIAEKRKLADDILAGDAEVNLTELPDEALMDLVRLDVTRAAS